MEPVAFVLEPVDLHQVVLHRFVVAKRHESKRDLLGRRGEHLAQSDRLLHWGLDPVDAHHFRRLLGIVDDVVERGRQGEARVGGKAGMRAADLELDDHLVGKAVAFGLELLHPGDEVPALRKAGDQGRERPGALDGIPPRLREQGQGLLPFSLAREYRHRGRDVRGERPAPSVPSPFVHTHFTTR